MNFAGRVWRAVVQNEEGLTFPRIQDALVDISCMPGFELLGLVLRQAGLHGKVRFGQVKGFLQFQWFGHRFARSNNSFVAFMPSFGSGVQRETSESSVRTYVTMNGSRCQPRETRNLSQPARILHVGYTERRVVASKLKR